MFQQSIIGKVELYWWGDNATWDLNNEVIEAIDDIYRENYEVMKER